MSSIPELYSLVNSSSGHGIQGYFVEKKYIDPLKIKQQRGYAQHPNSGKQVNVSKKTSFIDQIQKIAAKLPSPAQYEPKQYKSKSRQQSSLSVYADRKTIFDEMQYFQKKKNYPGAGTYLKEVVVDKSKIKSNLSKAQTPTYLQASMRNSLDCPGVGNYNACRQILDKTGGKINQQKYKSKNPTQPKLPAVGTYNPAPLSYNLFDGPKKKSKSHFNKQQRFKSSKGKTIPYYNVLSEWGMKDKTHKKDILSKVSTSTYKSVYY